MRCLVRQSKAKAISCQKKIPSETSGMIPNAARTDLTQQKNPKAHQKLWDSTQPKKKYYFLITFKVLT